MTAKTILTLSTTMLMLLMEGSDTAVVLLEETPGEKELNKLVTTELETALMEARMVFVEDVFWVDCIV